MSEGDSREADLALEVTRLSRQYGPVKALDDISLTARRGEFLSVLGQSGSGKTTLLRMIAGLDHPTSVAALKIGGKDVLGMPPHKRNVTTVFQHYALFPHMTVGENIAYPLKLKGIEGAQRSKRAHDMLETVRLPDMFDRRIHQLSGGERQRVALARSIINEPDILLLDEPLGALDERLRLDMQIELLQLQRSLGMTFVYITHSQEEALTMSDRVILMRQGRIEQEGTPMELFERPCSSFAAAFMGVENILSGQITAVDGGRVTISTEGGAFSGNWTGQTAAVVGTTASLLLRAEKTKLNGGSGIAGKISTSVYKGKFVEHVVETALGTILAITWNTRDLPSDEVTVSWGEADVTIAPVESFRSQSTEIQREACHDK